MHELILLRHGETAWSRDGKHTGRTDLPLTRRGEAAARTVGRALAGRTFALVLSSPLTRARQTAELAGLTDVRIDDDLREWDYGGYEGRTTPEITATRSGWDLWTDGVPSGDADHPGETVADVGARADGVLQRIGPSLANGLVVLVGHGHALRVLTARWLGLAPVYGRLFYLETATVSALGREHGNPVVRRLNASSLEEP